MKTRIRPVQHTSEMTSVADNSMPALPGGDVATGVRSFTETFSFGDLRRLAPLFILYSLIFVAISPPTAQTDEPRYIEFANNLAHGYYTDRAAISLWNGPGYPLVLAPFAALHLPWQAARFLNVLFLFFAVVYFYRTLRLYVKPRFALSFAYLLGILPPILPTMHPLMTEPLSTFLVCAFSFHLCKLISKPRKGFVALLLPSSCLAWLALTKIFFGYVILFCLLISLAALIFTKAARFRTLVLVHLLALAFCAPYLAYTYSLTGRLFYWGDSGGASIYWMASPYESELGDWHGNTRHMHDTMPLAPQHREFFDRLRPLSAIEQDDEMKKAAIRLIISHPKKFFSNWLANIGRLLFSYPFSYTPQKLSTFFYMIPNMFIVVLSILCLYPSIKRRARIPFEIWWLMFLVSISFAASSLLSAYERQFQILVPMLMLWLVFTLTRVVKIEIV